MVIIIIVQTKKYATIGVIIAYNNEAVFTVSVKENVKTV